MELTEKHKKLKELFRFQQELKKIAYDIPEDVYNKLQVRLAEKISVKNL